MDAFSKRLRLLRNERGWKQTEFAEKLNFSGAMASAYENGREPSYDMLVQIARLFHVSTDYLLGLTAVKQADPSALTTAIDQSAAAAEAAGVEPIGAEDIQRLMQQLTVYLRAPQCAGTLPVDTARQLLTGMTALLAALTSGSTAAVLDASNILLSAILSVSSITSAHLNGQKKGGTP